MKKDKSKEKEVEAKSDKKININVHVDFNSPSGFEPEEVSPQVLQQNTIRGPGLSDTMNKRNTVVGTPYWMAPEQITSNVNIESLELERATLNTEPADKYDKFEKIGEGAAGCVMMAERSDGRKVAVKEMYVSDMNEIEFMLAELNMRKNIVHENIVAVFDVYKTGDYLRVVSEVGVGVDFTTVLDHCDEIRISDAQIACVLKQVITALIFLENSGMMPSQVRSDDIMICANGVLKISSEDMRKSKHGIMQWAIAVLLMEMLEGEPPYMEFPPLRALFIIAKFGVSLSKPMQHSQIARSFFADCTRSLMLRPSLRSLLSHPLLKQACESSELIPLFEQVMELHRTSDYSAKKSEPESVTVSPWKSSRVMASEKSWIDYIDEAADGTFLSQRARLLSCAVELAENNTKALRAVAFAAMRYGLIDLAVLLARRVLELRAEEPQSWRDLACFLLASSQSESARAEALALLETVLTRKWSIRFNLIEMPVLLDYNRVAKLLGTHARAKNEWLFECELDLRVTLSWDSDLCDVELHVLEPSGVCCTPFNNLTPIGGLNGKNFTNGYGPNEYVLRRAISGTYRISAKLFHANGAIGDGVSVLCCIAKHFATPNEKVYFASVRLSSLKQQIEVATATF